MYSVPVADSECVLQKAIFVGPLLQSASHWLESASAQDFYFLVSKMFSFSGVLRCSSFGVTRQFLYVVYIVLFRLVRILYIIVVYRVRLIVRGVPPTNPSKGRQAFTLARYPSRVRALFHP